MKQERQRILSLEEATDTFALQLQILPDVKDEFMRLSGGSLGVVNALISAIANEISYTPMEDTTPQRIRTIVGAPNDAEQLSGWREQFWNTYKAAHTPPRH